MTNHDYMLGVISGKLDAVLSRLDAIDETAAKHAARLASLEQTKAKAAALATLGGAFGGAALGWAGNFLLHALR